MKKSVVIANNMRIPIYEKNEEGWKIVDFDYYKVNYIMHPDMDWTLMIVVNNIITPNYICLQSNVISPKDIILSSIGWFIENGETIGQECDENFYLKISDITTAFQGKVIHSILPISTEIKRDRLTKFKLVRESELID